MEPERCGRKTPAADAGFNGGWLRSCSWINRYFGLMETCYPVATISETKENQIRFAIGGRRCRDSEDGSIIARWVNDEFKPARRRLVRGKTELLLRDGIVKKQDSAVNFRIGEFKFGKSACEMMTYNDMHRLGISFSSERRAFAKLNGYLGNRKGGRAKF